MMKIGVLALYALMMVAVIVLTARKKLSLNEFLLGGAKNTFIRTTVNSLQL